MLLGVGGAARLSHQELGDYLVCLRQTIDRMELEFAELAAVFAATDEWEEQGSVSAIQWLRKNCKMGSGAAAVRVCVGERSAKLSEAVDAVAEGRIGFTHLALIARTDAAVSEGGRALDVVGLVQQAEKLTVSQFRNACQHARHAADAEGVAREERDAVEARFLELSTFEDGSYWIKGILDSAGGAALRSALEPLARRCGKDDDRARPRRLADALVELSAHALDSGALPSHGGQRPHLQVTTTLETLLGQAGAPAAEMEFSLPISSKAVERLACDCSLTRVLLSADSTVIDVGRSMRVVSGSRRRALNARDKHCRWPGCDRPVSWTTAHHLWSWGRGGDSGLGNQVLLCYRHHWMVHEGGWQVVVQQEGGELLAIPPPYAMDAWGRRLGFERSG